MMENQFILLVEDSEDDAFLFKWMFEKAGTEFRLQHAQNGAEAIEFLRTATSIGSLPRIVLLDLKMPMMNGFEVLSWMRRQTFSAPVPAVVLSGSDQKEDKERALRLGAVDYFVKPVRLPELLNILSRVSSNPKTALAETGACP